MYIYAQEGHGRGSKIQEGLRAGNLTGVILSPFDESELRQAVFIKELRLEFKDAVDILFDPQFYVSTLNPVRPRDLQGYDYFKPNLTRDDFTRPANIREYVSKTFDCQERLNLPRWISPTVMINDFSDEDSWRNISMSLANESVDSAGERQALGKLLVSFVFDEAAVRSMASLDSFLDTLTGWRIKPAGFYLLMRYRDERKYPANLEEAPLANLMYLVYVLSGLHGLEVILGFMDLPGLLLHAVGAYATGTGWHQSLRQFSLKRYQPRKPGGGGPNDRYTSAPLLNSILVVPELANIAEQGLNDMVLTRNDYDAAMDSATPGNAPWPQNTSYQHHWAVLASLARDISSQLDISDRLDRLQEMIDRALGIYDTIDAAGIVFSEETSRRNIEQWRGAVQRFRGMARV